MLLALPGVEEHVGWAGQPAFKVRKKGFVYLSADETSVMLKALREEQEALVAESPEIYTASWASGRFAWLEVKLAIADEDEFVEQAVAKLGPQPPNFKTIVELNKGPLSTAGAEAAALAPSEVDRRRAEGALIVDTRTDEQFDAGHVGGAVCIPMLSAGFGSKLAWLADADREIVLIGRDDRDGQRAVGLAAAIAVFNVAGYLGGGMASWHGEFKTIERLAVDRLARARAADPELQILDVRERGEWEAGHIPGSILRTWHDIDGVPAELDRGRPVAVICGSGERAATGASLLAHHGAERVVHVVGGGVPAWGRLGNELETDGGG
jgi:rhodanese-related sulfurtransferase